MYLKLYNTVYSSGSQNWEYCDKQIKYEHEFLSIINFYKYY